MSNTNADTQSATTGSFIAALVTAGIAVGALGALWLGLHGLKRLREVFQPRTEKAPVAKRPPLLPDGSLKFIQTIFRLPDQEVIVANGPDAYFFVRYLKIFGLYMLAPYFFFTFAILIPVSAASPNAGQNGLNMFTFGNVAPEHQVRHVAHCLVALLLINWTMYLLWREFNHFVRIRQEWLTSPQHLSLARTRTIAITNIPDAYNSASGLKELGGTVATLTGHAPPRASNVTDGTAVANVDTDAEGSIQQIWMPRKIQDVEEVWEERDAECGQLEGGIGKMIKLANKNYRKGKTPEKSGQYDSESSDHLVDRFVLAKKRPTWKQGFLGLVGQKMTLESSPAYIREHNEQLEQLRQDPSAYPPTNTAFLRFTSQADAHAFARLISSTDKKLRLVDSSIEIIPEDVEWTNLSISPYQRKIRNIVSWSLTIGLIIVWAIPVAFVGIVSNVDTLCDTAPFLAWICELPSPALAIIKGVLPPALLALLFILLPIVLRLMIQLQGEIRKSDIELKLFSRYWLFQVIHGFLIVTLSSGLTNALGNLAQTAASVPTLLAEGLPGASIFFLTYILTATFSSAAKTLARLVPVVMYYLRPILGGNTPRKWYQTTYTMAGIPWAIVWPRTCLILCITIVYSVIQPIITALAWVACVFLYAAYKYTLYWCVDQPDYLETGGQFYIKALRIIFVSLYLEEVCLAGLFFLSSDQNGGRTPSGLACGAIMIVQIVLTAAFQIYIDWFRFQPDYLTYAHSAHTVKNSKLGQIANKAGLPTSETAASPSEGKLGHVATTPAEEDANAGAEYGNTTGFHDRAFDHPAMWKAQPVIWVADDPLGVGKFEVERIRSFNVNASTEYAGMDEKGRLHVRRAPPDEAWYGGMTS